MVVEIIVEYNNIITAGGVSAYIDLCVDIVRKFISIDITYIDVDTGRRSKQHYKNLSNMAISNDKTIESI